jgi:transposase InsO family protein
MNDQEPTKEKTKSKKYHRNQNRYPYEYKIKAVKLYLEEDYTAQFIAEQLGVGLSTISTWAKKYRALGEDGLKTGKPDERTPSSNPAIQNEILQVKTEHSLFGSQKITDFLRRIKFIKTNPETVRQTLIKEGLNTPRGRKSAKRNPEKPRFFERSTPNQLWQSDIMSFRLGGQVAYLIGFIDDYSRFMVSVDVLRSQTAEHVIEIYRQGVAEYGVPKEVLTDNGRQYTNWRGTTRFELELKKDNILHLKSRPHHPMTLGKIERFWKTIFEEFLSRAQFDDFENARERLRLWVKYYNYKRPHQGIEGLCPADRFFEIQSELRKTMERGIAENTLEMALRGKPKQPFYMVGRLGDQAVALRAEKGKLSMVIDDKNDGQVQEIIYDITKGASNGDIKKAEAERQYNSADQMRSGSLDMDSTPQASRSVPGTECSVGNSESMAGPGTESNDRIPGATADTTGRNTETSGATPEVIQSTGGRPSTEVDSAQVGSTLEQDPARKEHEENAERRITANPGSDDYGPKQDIRSGESNQGENSRDHEGSGGPSDSH